MLNKVLSNACKTLLTGVVLALIASCGASKDQGFYQIGNSSPNDIRDNVCVDIDINGSDCRIAVEGIRLYQVGQSHEYGAPSDVALAVTNYEQSVTKGNKDSLEAILRLFKKSYNLKAYNALLRLISGGHVDQDYLKVDANGNGLIDVFSLDMLNQMRHNFQGTSYKRTAHDVGDTSGCPEVTGCYGYELVIDLDFNDSSRYFSGAVNTAWTTGEGWTPIGPQTASSTAFNAIFDGNGYIIKGLFINNTQADTLYSALFSTTGENSALRNVELQNVNITTSNTNGYAAALAAQPSGKMENIVLANVTITGNDFVGALASKLSSNARVSNTFIKNVRVTGSANVGAAVGQMQPGSLLQQTTILSPTGLIKGDYNVGGLVGSVSAEGQAYIYNYSSEVPVQGTRDTAGIIGRLDSISGMQTVNYGLSFNHVSGGRKNVHQIYGLTLEISADLRASYYPNTLRAPVHGHYDSYSIATIADLKNPRSTLYTYWGPWTFRTQWSAANKHYEICGTRRFRACNGSSASSWKFTNGEYPRLNYENYPVPAGQKKFWTAERVARLYATN